MQGDLCTEDTGPDIFGRQHFLGLCMPNVKPILVIDPGLCKALFN